MILQYLVPVSPLLFGTGKIEVACGCRCPELLCLLCVGGTHVSRDFIFIHHSKSEVENEKMLYLDRVLVATQNEQARTFDF